MNIPKPTCDKCGKEAPIDKEQSNNNWKVYDIKNPCRCGGKFTLSFSK